jgi:hypothetical protein
MDAPAVVAVAPVAVMIVPVEIVILIHRAPIVAVAIIAPVIGIHRATRQHRGRQRSRR